MFNWFKKKEEVKPSVLNTQIVTSIMIEFMGWYHKEIELYTGDADKSMVFNIATMNPNIFLNKELGMELVNRYFVVSGNKDQKITTRMKIFVSKITLLFGIDVVTELKERSITSLIVDFNIPEDLVEAYVRVSDLFWLYPLLLIQGNLEFLGVAPGSMPEAQ